MHLYHFAAAERIIPYFVLNEHLIIAAIIFSPFHESLNTGVIIRDCEERLSLLRSVKKVPLMT